MRKASLIIIGLIIVSLITIFIYKIKGKEDKKVIVPFVNYNLYFNEYVKTNKIADIYTKTSNTYKKVGTIAKDVELTLDENVIDKYFMIKNLDEEYYISYLDVDKIDTLAIKDDRYKNYIVFNENVITKNKVSFYQNDKEVYSFLKEFNLPIIVKDDKNVYVEYDNMLLQIKESDISSIIKNSNTDLSNTKDILVLTYHAIYDPKTEKCNTSICLKEEKFDKQMKMIRDNNIFSLTLNELEMYIDGKINLPKSIVVTIDDGFLGQRAVKILDDNKVNGTLFLITSAFKVSDFAKSEYFEIHSHGHKIHNVGDCPGGQGGAIKCKDEKYLLEDLEKSRSILNNSPYFCFPFFEYNDYALKIVKKAGFRMSFVGKSAKGNTKAKVGINKYLIPRKTIFNSTTDKEFLELVS